MCFMPVDQPLPGSITETNRRKSVTKTDRTEPESGDNPTANQGGPRRTRGIRFSDPEWEEVKAAAELHDVPAAEFVRKRILDVARGCARTTPASLAPLIERSIRYTYMPSRVQLRSLPSNPIRLSEANGKCHPLLDNFLTL